MNELLNYLPQRVRIVLRNARKEVLERIEEIRMRAGKPLMVQDRNRDWFVNTVGKLVLNNRDAFIINREDLEEAVALMSGNSVYAFQDEIRNGFITLNGGHRVGIAGKVVLDGNGIKNIRDISGLNIRVSREIPGCSSEVVRYILGNKDLIYNTLIISPPMCGKTTILRDVARTLSDGIEELGFDGAKVGIVDERSEIAACFRGIPQNWVGVRTDVLDGCPKSLGMALMIRSMSPHVIVTDEIGGCGDCDAVMRVVNAGVKIIATAHGYNISELKTRREVVTLIEEKVFDRYIVLSAQNGPGTLEEVIDGRTMAILYRRGQKCL